MSVETKGDNKTMYSKMVNDRQRTTRMVVEAAFTHAVAVGARLDATLVAPLPEEGTGGWAGRINVLGRTLQAGSDTLVAADRAHEAEKADDVAVRLELDEAIEGLYREVVDLRTGLEAVAGTEAMVQAGLTGTTPREPVALARLGQALHTALPTLAAVPSVRRGLTFDASSYELPLAKALARLDSALGAMRREERELEATLVAKNRALAEHDTRFLQIARVLESLFRLAGFDELADRVRPSIRRPGQVENPPPEAPAEPPIVTDPIETKPAAA
jgi:hypothetical protein